MSRVDPTPTEQQILRALGDMWNLYLTLPVEHPDDRGDFRRIIHNAQARILMRPTRRMWIAE